MNGSHAGGGGTAPPPRAPWLDAGLQLAAAPDEAARDRILRRRKRLLRAEVATALVEAARQELRVDTRRSRALADGALILARRLGDARLEGQALRAQANALWASGQNAEAVALHDGALERFEALNDRAEVARTLNASIQPLILLGQYERAMGAAERARELFAALGDELRLARLVINVGNLLHRQDRFDEALDCYEGAYGRLQALGDVDGIITALHNKAVSLITLNRFREAQAAYQRARDLCVEHRLPVALAQADYNIAWLHYLRGEYGRAIELLQATQQECRHTGDLYHTALCQLDLSDIYLELNLSADARELAEQAHGRFVQLGMGYETAKALAHLAIAHGQEGRAFRALELFSEARAVFVAENNYAWPSLVDLYQAILLSEEGRLFEARRLGAAALAFFESSLLPSKAVLCRLVLARIALRLGDAPLARTHCDAALDRLGTLDAPPLLYQARYVLGQIHAALGCPREAYHAYLAAREALEAMRGTLRTDELKIAFVKNKSEVYEHLVELALEAGSAAGCEDAFTYIEEAKSRSLIDLIFQPVHRLAKADAPESDLVRSVGELREELNWYYHLIEQEQLRPGERTPARLDALQREAAVRERDLARVMRELPQDVQQPEHAAAVFALQAVRDALAPETVLVEYFQAHDRILACIADRTDLRILPVSLASRVASHLRLLQFQLSKFRLGSDYVTAFGDSLLEATMAHLQALHGELLAPVWSRLRGRHLLVVPHGFLHHVPFHALFDGHDYVVDACTVSYAPSASVYVLCERQPPASACGALVLGVADENAPEIEAEARQVAATLPGAELYLGPTATAAVLRERGAASRVIHIASHGRFRADSPMFSGIRLGDGYLNVYDLYRARLPADVVTLSGCATGQSLLGPGDELLGLVRGLFAAGARTLVTSLWDVHDRSTAALVTSFYGKFCAGIPPAEALRDAMLAVRRDHPHPYYWAPFILAGRYQR